jgi:hypothetical protein
MKLRLTVKSAYLFWHSITMLLVREKGLNVFLNRYPSIFSWQYNWGMAHFDNEEHSWSKIGSYLFILLKVVYRSLITHPFSFLWTCRRENFIDVSFDKNHYEDRWDRLRNTISIIINQIIYFNGFFSSFKIKYVIDHIEEWVVSILLNTKL